MPGTCPIRRSELAEDVDQFGDLAALPIRVAGSDGVLDAVRDMVAQDLLLDALERRSGGGDLRDHVDAVAVFLDHAGETADLTFDAAEAFETGGLGFGLHGCYIPIQGMGV